MRTIIKGNTKKKNKKNKKKNKKIHTHAPPNIQTSRQREQEYKGTQTIHKLIRERERGRERERKRERER
jgi:hypothetical protein